MIVLAEAPRRAAPSPAAREQERAAARRTVDYVRRRINGLTEQTARMVAVFYADGGRELEAQLRRIIDSFGGEATWRLDPPSGAIPLGAQAQARRVAALLQQADGTLQRLLSLCQDATTRAAILAHRQAYWGASWLLDQQLPVGLSVSAPLLPTEAVQAAVLSPYKGLTYLERYAQQRPAFLVSLRRTIALSQISGDSVSRATSRLLRALGVPVGGPVPVGDRRAAAAQALDIPVQTRGMTPRMHAELVVRTEIQRSAFTGTMAVYDRNQDVLKGWEWVATNDRITCPVCIPLDGKVYALDDETAPTIPRHPRCRCVAVSVTRSFAELGLSDLAAQEPKPRQTYSQWAAERGVSAAEDGGLREQRPVRVERERGERP